MIAKSWFAMRRLIESYHHFKVDFQSLIQKENKNAECLNYQQCLRGIQQIFNEDSLIFKTSRILQSFNLQLRLSPP